MMISNDRRVERFQQRRESRVTGGQSIALVECRDDYGEFDAHGLGPGGPFKPGGEDRSERHVRARVGSSDGGVNAPRS